MANEWVKSYINMKFECVKKCEEEIKRQYEIQRIRLREIVEVLRNGGFKTKIMKLEEVENVEFKVQTDFDYPMSFIEILITPVKLFDLWDENNIDEQIEYENKIFYKINNLLNDLDIDNEYFEIRITGVKINIKRLEDLKI